MTSIAAFIASAATSTSGMKSSPVAIMPPASSIALISASFMITLASVPASSSARARLAAASASPVRTACLMSLIDMWSSSRPGDAEVSRCPAGHGHSALSARATTSSMSRRTSSGRSTGLICVFSRRYSSTARS